MKEMTTKQPPIWIVLFLLGLQLVVFYGHWLLYVTTVFAFLPPRPVALWLRGIIFILSISFLATQILVNKFNSRVLDILYTAAAVWIGTMQFLVMGCIIFWTWLTISTRFGAIPPWIFLGSALFILAFLMSAYTTARSFRPQYRRYYVNLPNLPEAWRGRKAILVSDVHLGNIRGNGSTRKIVEMINAENPDIVFIPGDLFDGPPTNFEWMAAPLRDIKATGGVYFSEGNHEEFHDPTPYLAAIRAAGVRVLDKEMVLIDGMQVLGIPYHSSNEADEIRSSLAMIPFDPEKPSILLKHAPSAPRAAAAAGISLMLSGHTHNGQMWPYSFFVRRLFGKAGYGHSNSGNMQIITTSGYGTWGPPQRLGTRAEIVVIKFS